MGIALKWRERPFKVTVDVYMSVFICFLTWEW